MDQKHYNLQFVDIAENVFKRLLVFVLVFEDDKLDLVMNGTEDLLFSLFCGDAVRAARPAVLIV